MAYQPKGVGYHLLAPSSACLLMRITAIHEKPINLQGNIANAVVDFSSHTVSMVAVINDPIETANR